MKAAIVFDGLGFGGIERVGLQYVKLLQNLGYEIDIYNLKPEANEMEQFVSKNCNIIHCNFSYNTIPDYYMLMVKRYRWGKYVYPFVYLGASMLMYGKRIMRGKRKKYNIAIAFSGHMRDLTFVAYNYICAEKKVAWLHGALIEYMASSCTYGDLYRKIKNICVLSEVMQDLAINVNRYLDELKIQKIYNPIEMPEDSLDEKFCRELISKYGNYLLMVGRFEKDKDQKTVINAIKILKEKYGKNPHFIFVGGGSTLEECKLYAETLNLQDKVTFFGPRSDVGNFYNGAKIFVHSSPAEGLPTVLLEAMSFGVPVVATDSPPGVTEILKNDLYGLRCEIGNPEDMAEAINRLLEDEDMYRHYVEQGLKRVEDFSSLKIQEQLKQMLEQLK